MAQFNLGELIKQGKVPNLGITQNQEQIEYIALDLIDDDPRNFYELSGLDELAANIELLGLQQPIRVRSNPEDPSRVIIVSGHRRRAAIRKLAEEAPEKWQKVPCIREHGEVSPALQELRLIYANSDTRKLSSADLAKQAERVEALLYQLKEEGYEFPGRMRDHVAQACQISKSKLARLKVIRENLHPMLLEDWESGRISDTVAYRIAQEDEHIQNRLFSDHGHAPRTWTEEHAERAIGRIKTPPPSKPINFKALDAKTMANDYLEQRAEENEWFFRNMKNHIFDMMIGGFTVIPTRQDGIAYLKDYHSNGGFWGAVHFDRSKTGLEIYKDKRSSEKVKRSWTEVWDCMACIALQRCAAEHNKPKKPEPTGQLVFSGWMPGGTNPSAPCDVVAVFDLGAGNKVKKLARWNGQDFLFAKGGAKIEMPVVKWMALPPDEEEET